jgi:hypothetical protein
MHLKGAASAIAFATALAFSGLPARAETLLVTWTEDDPDLGINIDVSWEMSSTPTPIFSVHGVGTDVPIFDFTSTGTTSVGPYSDMGWYSASQGGLFYTPDKLYEVDGAQAYSGPESAPVFLTGVYPGIDVANSDASATVTISTIPEPSTWTMMLLGFAGLGFAGLRARRKTAEPAV